MLRCRLRVTALRRYRRGAHLPQLGGEEVLLGGKDRHEVAAGLQKLGFEEVGGTNETANAPGDSLFLNYLRHCSTGFKSSKRNLSALQRAFKEADPALDKRPILFTYFLHEAELEVRRLHNYSPSEINEMIAAKSEELLESAMGSEDALEQYVLSDWSATDPGSNYMIHTDALLTVLHSLTLDPSFKPSEEGVSMDSLVEAFEFAKSIPSPDKRHRGLMTAGRLIYSSGKVRMDPVNESFYINALLAFGNHREAYSLFKSRKDKFPEKWWYTLGLNITLASNNLRGFKRLLQETDDLFPETLPYLDIKVLRFAIKKFLKVDNVAMTTLLTNRFLEIVRLQGLSSEDEKKDAKFEMFQDDNEANSYLNRVEAPTQHDFTAIINYFVHKKNMPMVKELFKTYVALPNVNKDYNDFILRTNLNLLDDFASFKRMLDKGSGASSSSRENVEILEAEFQKIVASYDTSDTVVRSLLFKNINDLISHRSLSHAMATILNKSVAAETEETEETDSQGDMPSPSTKSEQYRTLLDTLLTTHKDDEALQTLDKLERNFVSHEDETLPQVNAHHYAVFIENYYKRINYARNRKSLTYDKYVEDILKRMNALSVPYNAVFISRLLKYYRSRNNLNNCFKIVGSLFDPGAGSANPHSQDDSILPDTKANMFSRRELNSLLYSEIWRVYYDYYSNKQRPHYSVTGSNRKVMWRSYFAKVNESIDSIPDFDLIWLFKNMDINDNVLPSLKMYKIIVGTFMKSNNWNALPAVLTIMSDVHGIPVDATFAAYILLGLKREFIINEAQRCLIKNPQCSIIDARCHAQTVYSQRVKDKVFFNPYPLINPPKTEPAPEVTVETVLTEILILLKYQNPYDVNFTSVIEAFGALGQSPENMAEIISHVNKKITTY